MNNYVDRRIEIANHFIKNIINSALLYENIIFQKVLNNAKSSWFGFPVVFKKLHFEEIQRLRKKLLDSKIETRPFLAGDFSLQPVNKKFDHLCFDSLSNIKFIHNKSFALPCHQGITKAEVDKICKIIEQFLSKL